MFDQAEGLNLIALIARIASADSQLQLSAVCVTDRVCGLASGRRSAQLLCL